MKKKSLKLDIKFIVQIIIIAIYLIGCSGANTAPTLEATPTDTPVLIPTATNTPLPPTKTPTHTPIPPTPTETGKSEEYYKQSAEDLKTFNLFMNSNMSSLTGLGINNYDDDGSYNSETFKKRYLEKYIELVCNMPHLARDIQIDPFLFVNPNGSTDGKPAENIKINVGKCELTKEKLEQIEANGYTIVLSWPIFEEGASNIIKDMFPEIKGIYEFDKNNQETGYKSSNFYWFNGIVLGNKGYNNTGSEVIDIFNRTYGLNHEFFFGRAVFKPGSTSFTLPVDSEGNLIFGSIVIFSNDITSKDLVEEVFKGTLSHQILNDQFVFSSASFEE
ncbi:MAG: hypothetical protein KF758_02050 [Anaerolineales bacterium]|nr:hypothetical protein [Anaerolineales bacterium]